ncbi:MAG: hypothetical protein IAE85_07680 [Anaerolinea sp.]|nr:hypothetical protein [Anaerolinea sp.]
MSNVLFSITGSFGWPRYENGQPTLPEIPGVYLMTVAYEDGFLPYGVGVTRRPVKRRFVEHTRKFVNGEYNILDLDHAQQGIRKVVWKGWGWTPEKRADYEARKSQIIALAQQQMLGTHIFVIETGTAVRLLERIEAAIANHYYKRDEILFDRGTLCMPRWEAEEPIFATFHCQSNLYGFPYQVEV